MGKPSCFEFLFEKENILISRKISITPGSFPQTRSSARRQDAPAPHLHICVDAPPHRVCPRCRNLIHHRSNGDQQNQMGENRPAVQVSDTYHNRPGAFAAHRSSAWPGRPARVHLRPLHARSRACSALCLYEKEERVWDEEEIEKTV